MPRSRFAPGLLAVVALALAVSSLVGRPALAQDGENPILAQVKAALKDPAKPFTMSVQLRVKEGTGEKFEAAFAKAIKPTRQEKGCLQYDLSRDTKTPTLYVAYERWRDLAALEAHLDAPHFKELVAEVGEMFEGPPVFQVLVPVAN